MISQPMLKQMGDVWAILPSRLNTILQSLYEPETYGSSRATIDSTDVSGARKKRGPNMVSGNVALLALHGLISQRLNALSWFFGGTSTQEFGRWFDEAVADESIGAIVLDVDSGGGSVLGVQELSQKIFEARGTKPIVAVANSMAASAAYWIASAADEIVITPSGEVGSIGVIAVHADVSSMDAQIGVKYNFITSSKFKAEGNMHEPLSDEAREYIQGRVDEYHDAFVSDLARNRGVTKRDINAHFGKGRMFGADQAVRDGMANRVGTLEETLQGLGVKRVGGNRSAATEGENSQPHCSVDIRRRRQRMRQTFQKAENCI